MRRGLIIHMLNVLRQTRVDAWTGIRAIAALWVVLFHLANYNLKLDFGWMTPFIGRGELGVDLFFILSGIVISYVHQAEFFTWNQALALRFWVLRFARIYPLHLVMLLIMAANQQVENGYSWLVSHHAALHHMDSLQNFGLSLLNIHGWETTPVLSFNFPSWSVSAEWFVYLLFPFFAPLLLRVRSLWLNLLLITASLTALYIVCMFNHENTMGFTTHLGLVRVSTEFTVGCGLYNLLKLQQKPLPGANYLALAALLLIPILILQKPHEIWIVVLLGLFLYLLPMVSGWFKSLFANRLMVFGGEISYAIYMVHALILHSINDTFVFYFHHERLSQWETAGVSLFVLVLVVIAATALNRYIEVPARNAIRRYWEGRKQSAPLPS